MSAVAASRSDQAVVDTEARERALDVTSSFVVQAPAGSGKTGLLVQRFLALLARVERPEAVLAITFTRKAAGEMRRRIVEALRDAKSRTCAPETAFERTRYELALAVLGRDAAKGWGLLHSPSRLQVFTIDGFCSRVVAGTPLLSRLGSTPAVVDDADALYREAVRRTLAPAGRALLAGELEVLLERYEMGLERLETQLVEMLSRRDQWSEAFFNSRHDEAAWVRDVEAAFEHAIGAEVASIAADLDDGIVSRIHALARRSRLGGAGLAWPTLGDDDLLGHDASAAWAWRQASDLLLKNRKLRTRRSKSEDVHGGDIALKGDFAALVEDIASLPELTAARWVEGLNAAARLPTQALFSEGGRSAVGAFLGVLRHAFLSLWEVFRERHEVDHVEIAMRAVAALAPGETLEKLDAKIEHILVDEFQDTNVLQCNLLRGLTRGWQRDDARTLFLVGDPMQSIYRFRKAEVGLFLSARSSPRFLPNVQLEPLTLSVNFRSTRAVVGWVNRTFQVLLGDRDDATRSLVAFAPADPGPGADEGERVETLIWESGAPAGGSAATSGWVAMPGAEADRIEAEGLADWIAAECRRHRAQRATDQSPATPPIAVLVRARNHALPLLRALERRASDVRLRAPGLDKLAHRTIVVDLEALTRALLHPGDRLSWLALLRSPWIGLGLGDLARLVEPDVAAALAARQRPTPLPTLLRDSQALARVGDDARRRISRWIAIADAARSQLASRPVDIVVRTAWLRLGGPASAGEAAKLESLDADAYFDLLATRVNGGSVNFEDLSRALVATDAAVDSDAEADVEIMTMHKAKGLEFDTVVLPALGNAASGSTSLPLAMETEPDSGVLRLVAPRGARGREDSDLDKYSFLQFREKRRSDAEMLRLLYVASTRAKRRLVLSVSRGRLTKEGAPRSGSLLGALARAVDISQARIVQVESVIDGPIAARSMHAGMTRFPHDFVLVAAPPSVPDRSVTSESPSDLEIRPEYLTEDKTAAHVGTVFHAVVERIAGDGLDAWPLSRLESERTRVAHALRTAGVMAEALPEAIERVLRSLACMLDDEKGRWILADHDSARSEWALTALRERRLTSAKLDRTFVDDGSHWIVDFKTIAWPGHDGDAADRFVVETCAHHVLQLSRYRDLLRDGTPDAALPIRIALYFPEWPQNRRWQEITDLVDALDAVAQAS